MGKSGGHPKVRNEKLHNPCPCVEREALLSKELRVYFEPVVKDQKLIIYRPVLIKQFLG